MAALFPKAKRMDAIERITLSFGIGIAIVLIIGLMLNYSPNRAVVIRLLSKILL